MSRRQNGFTLFETIIALVVFSFAFVSFCRGLAGGSWSSRIANSEAAAMAVASAQLAAAGIETALKDVGDYNGVDGPYSWRVRFAPAPVARDRDALSGVVGYWVDVDVIWREGPLQKPRTVQLRTLKLGFR